MCEGFSLDLRTSGDRAPGEKKKGKKKKNPQAESELGEGERKRSAGRNRRKKPNRRGAIAALGYWHEVA